jgi:hypothetical protein
MNTKLALEDKEKNYIVLCDFVTDKWPIGNDYDQFKKLLREDVAKGLRIEHINYFPLLVFELK